MKDVLGGLEDPNGPGGSGDPTCRHWWIVGGYKVYSDLEHKDAAVTAADNNVGNYGQSGSGWCCASCPTAL